MSRILARSSFKIECSDSVLGFEQAAGGQFPVWDRYLTVDGRRAYHIGNVCGTCAFFFERLEGANQSVSPSAVSGQLEEGLSGLDPTFLENVSKIIPAGYYQVALSTVTPKAVKLGRRADYYHSEQVRLWGIDSFWGMPHNPKINYYRGPSLPMGDGDALFEFLIPMFPEQWLKKEQVRDYAGKLRAGSRPTALALSILDVKQPSAWEGDPSIKRHYCLAHYLIDGHHKTYAGARTRRPITLLSFLAVDESIASGEDIDKVLDRIEDSAMRSRWHPGRWFA